MKISILTPDFSNNCLGRAWLLARLLQNNFDIEVIGPAFGDGVWKPLRNLCDFPIKMVKSYPNGQFEFKKMLRAITGDVIYASKPRMSSFGVGLLKKIISGKPLVLDIDDWEPGFLGDSYSSLIWYKKINAFRLSASDWKSEHYSIIFNKLTWCANEITVSGNTLQQIYNGKIIWHTRDDFIFKPEKFNCNELKEKHLNLHHENNFIIGFIGTPRPHKGLEILIEAFCRIQNPHLFLLIVGLDETPYSRCIITKIDTLKIRERAFLFPEQPFELLPEFLSLTDLIAIPQSKRSASYGQVPAKIFDAMAMGKPIIATETSDIPRILNGCGLVVSPDNPEKLADAINYLINNPKRASEFGRKARIKFEKYYSWEKMQDSLSCIFNKYI
jgi:glycosyltransferase involved in cell wall biosynthesis